MSRISSIVQDPKNEIGSVFADVLVFTRTGAVLFKEEINNYSYKKWPNVIINPDKTIIDEGVPLKYLTLKGGKIKKMNYFQKRLRDKKILAFGMVLNVERLEPEEFIPNANVAYATTITSALATAGALAYGVSKIL